MNTGNLIISAILLCSVVFVLFFISHQYVEGIIEPRTAKSSTRIFETYVPGYDVISELSMSILGIKADAFLSVGLFLYIAWMTFMIASKNIWALAQRYFLPTIVIGSYDDLYFGVLDYLIEQRMFESSRSLIARTTTRVPRDDWNKVKSNIDPNSKFDLNDWKLGIPLTYEPDYQTYFCWHDGKPFWIGRSKEQFSLLEGSAREFNIILKCFGWSTKPIKDLIQRSRERECRMQEAYTEIRLPLDKKQRTGLRAPWAGKISRRSRPMDTVILNADQKSRIQRDIAEFLHPNTRRWYYDRGIPYRRGHLFHGAAGTGKTSLSLALAGQFRLTIHYILLSDPTLTDDDLVRLFQAMSDPCMVLLEDIDATSIVRGRTSTISGKKRESSIMEINPGPEVDQGISLSGLLNAVDGVASAEGVVLIMSTNHPEKLDDALIRDGRVDLKIEFTLPRKEELRRLFIRMYRSPYETAVPAELDDMAEAFATRLSENIFSAAEIQGFLLDRKNDAQDALAAVSQWAKDKMAAKAKQKS